MPGPIRKSSLIVQAGRSNANVGQAAIAGVAAGGMLIAPVVAHCSTTVQAGDIVSGYVSTPARTWTLATRRARTEGTWRTEVSIWIAHNVPAGTVSGAPTFTSGANPGHEVWHHMDEWAGMLAAAAVDKTSAVDQGENLATITVPPTPVLAQADQVVYAVAASRYNFAWNGNFAPPGTPPSGWDISEGTTDNSAMVAQSVYREVASTAGIGVSWGYAQQPGDRGAVAALVTLRKGGVATLRLEIDDIDETDIAGTSGWTIWAWAGDPLDGAAARRWTGYTPVVTAGRLILPDAPPGASLNDVYNVSGYRPAGNQSLAWGPGVVRQAS